MSFLGDLKGLVNDAVSKIRGLGDDLAHDLKDGISTIESEVDTLEQKLQQDAANLEKDLADVLAQAAAGWKQYSDDVNAIRAAVANWASSSATQTARSTLESKAKSQTIDQETWTTMGSMHSSLASAASGSSSAATMSSAAGSSSSAASNPVSKLISEFDTFSFSFGGDVDVIASFDGTAGYAIKTAKQDYRFTADLAAGIGADLEADLDAKAGFWNRSPHDMKGAFFAVEASAADEVGVAASAIFDFPSMSLIGFVFAVDAGLGFSFETKLGYTMTWK